MNKIPNSPTRKAQGDVLYVSTCTVREISQVGGMPWNAMGYRWILWEIVQSTLECRGKSVGYREEGEVLYTSRPSTVRERKSVKYRELPWVTVGSRSQYHAIEWEIDGKLFQFRSSRNSATPD